MTYLILRSPCEKEISPRNASKEKEQLSTALLNKRSVSDRGVQLYASLSMLASQDWTSRTALLYHRNSLWRTYLELKFEEIFLIPLETKTKKYVYGILIIIKFFLLYLLESLFSVSGLSGIDLSSYICFWRAREHQWIRVRETEWVKERERERV